MKEIENKKQLLHMKVKTNAILNAMAIVHRITLLKTKSNFMHRIDEETYEYDLVYFLSHKFDDDGKKLPDDTLIEIRLVCLAVDEIRSYIDMHLQNKIKTIENFNEKDTEYIQNKIKGLNIMYRKYKKLIKQIDGVDFDDDANIQLSSK